MTRTRDINRLLAFGLLLMPITLVSAQVIEPFPCPAVPGFNDWGREAWGTQPIWLGAQPTPELPHDVTVRLLLRPIETVEFDRPLKRAVLPSDHGGVINVRVTTSGLYRIALGEEGNVDLLRGKKSARPVEYLKGGSTCAHLARMIDFDLKQGVYSLQLSAVAEPIIQVAIRKLS